MKNTLVTITLGLCVVLSTSTFAAGSKINKSKIINKSTNKNVINAAIGKEISKKRAKAVKDYLARNYNIGSDRLLVSGKGEHTPLPNSNPYDAINRRVQFLPVQ